MKTRKLDKTDKIILNELQKDSQRSVTVLAARAGLSPSSCHRRVKLLEEAGVITGYAAMLDRTMLGLANEFFVEISLSAQTEEAFEKFEKAILRVPEIVECHLMSGQFDYLLRIVAMDAADYERIHRSRISRLPGVQRIQSSLALRIMKPWAGYPI
jgi:Lrp/AsnC family transcriptional regulator, leucine-responsive regulatory protein